MEKLTQTETSMQNEIATQFDKISIGLDQVKDQLREIEEILSAFTVETTLMIAYPDKNPNENLQAKCKHLLKLFLEKDIQPK